MVEIDDAVSFGDGPKLGARVAVVRSRPSGEARQAPRPATKNPSCQSRPAHGTGPAPPKARCVSASKAGGTLEGAVTTLGEAQGQPPDPTRVTALRLDAEHDQVACCLVPDRPGPNARGVSGRALPHKADPGQGNRRVAEFVGTARVAHGAGSGAEVLPLRGYGFPVGVAVGDASEEVSRAADYVPARSPSAARSRGVAGSQHPPQLGEGGTERR